MKAIGKSILEPRPPSRPKVPENDLGKPFASLEEDILNLQNYIERSKLKNLDSGIYRGKLISRKLLNNTNKHANPSITENLQSLQQYRNATLTEPVYNLVMSTLGPNYSSIPSDTILRLSLLKIKLHEIFLKKISELISIKLGEFEIDTEERLIASLYKFYENSNESKEILMDDSKIKELEQEIQQLKFELKKEAKIRKDCEDSLARYIIIDKQKVDDLEIINKKNKENEENKNRIVILMNEIEKLKQKLEQKESFEAKVTFLKSETDNLSIKLLENNEINEKLNRELKKLKENVEACKIKEKLNLNMIDSLNRQIEEIKAANKEINQSKNIDNASIIKEYTDKITQLEKEFNSRMQDNLLKFSKDTNTLKEKIINLEQEIIKSDLLKEKIRNLEQDIIKSDSLKEKIINLEHEIIKSNVLKEKIRNLEQESANLD